ncbi:MAG: glycosyltransferase family 4 protein [Desulfobacteraceae bacterium]|nr:glycosyltransferase family 4 protein [Desulfobacteraceae bacterium]
MKIAFVAQPIDSVIPPRQNSIGIIIYEIASRLDKSHYVGVYLKGGKIKQRKKVVGNVAYNFIPTGPDNRINRFMHRYSKHFKAERPFYASWLHYFGYALQIAIQINRLKYDIVHIINFSQFIPIIRKINPKVKIVLHMECEWLNQLDYSMIKHRIGKADQIIGCSEYITQRIRDRFPELAASNHTLFNGVNPNQSSINGQKTDKTDSSKRLLFVGRLSPEKGVHVLLDAYQKIIRHDKNVTLTLIGPQSAAPAEYIVNISDDPKVKELSSYYGSGYQDILEKQIFEHINKDIFFINSLPYKEIVRYYFDTDVFVFPSVWHEPFGMPVIEAMVCGKPVVATRSGGIPELIEDGRSGLLVDRDDSDALAGAILRLLNDKNLRESMGKAGRERVLEKFTWDKVANDLMKLYQSIL